MEYLILFISFWIVPLIVGRFILTKETLLMMSPLKSIIMPYLVIDLFIYLITVGLTMIRAIRTCPVEADKPRSIGVSSGLKLGFSSAIIAITMYVIIGMFPVLMMPFIALSILPYSTQIGEGF